MRLRSRACFLICLFLFAGRADAYIRTMAETGRPLYWASPNISLYANPQNSSGLTGAEVQALFTAAFNSWSVSGTSAQTSYSQSTGAPANGNFNGVNSVFFTSASGRPMDTGVIAVTEVTYYLNTGQIVETDISFNDNQYRFTANEGDTGRVIGGKLAVYLRDVATHEAGHAFGLDHSLVNLSSLIYTAFSGQFTLSKDDQTAIRTVYPTGGGNGALTGGVYGRRGGIFGAHVAAVNLDNGSVQSGGLANPDGSFRLGDIPPGNYALLMEPFGQSIYSISSYFQNVNHRFCPGNFRRRFYGPCGTNQASVVEVAVGRTTEVGALAPSCSQMGNPLGEPGSLATAADFPAGGGARFGTLAPGASHYYRLRGAGGLVKARAHSYTLYSNVDVKVDILDQHGNDIAGAVSVDNVQNPMPGGYVNYDSYAEANLPNGDYIVRVRAASPRLSAGVYSAGYDLQDTSGHYLLSLSVNGGFGAGGHTDMSSCVSLNNTSQSASYRAPASTGGRESAGGSGCGTLGFPDGPGQGGGGPLAATILLLAIHGAWLVMRRFKAALVRKRR